MLVAIALSLGVILPAEAGRGWCARDPIVTLNGQPVQIWIMIPDGYEQVVTGPVDVKIQVPEGVVTDTVFTDIGFNGYGETVKYTVLEGAEIAPDGSFDVQIQADIPYDRKLYQQLSGENGKMPFLITATTGGVLERNGSSLTMVGGETLEVEGTNYGTKITFRLDGSGGFDSAPISPAP